MSITAHPAVGRPSVGRLCSLSPRQHHSTPSRWQAPREAGLLYSKKKIGDEADVGAVARMLNSRLGPLKHFEL